MPVIESDIVYMLTTKLGSAGYTTASTPAASLGKYVSTTPVDQVTTLQNVFRQITSAEALAGIVLYRAVAILNGNASEAWGTSSVKAWYETGQTGTGVTLSMGADPAADSDKDSASAQGAEIADEETAPAGVTFTNPTDEAGGEEIDPIAADSVKILWLRAVIAPGTSLSAPHEFQLAVRKVA